MWIISLFASLKDFANKDKNLYTYFNTKSASPLKPLKGSFDNPMKFNIIGCKSLFFINL